MSHSGTSIEIGSLRSFLQGAGFRAPIAVLAAGMVLLAIAFSGSGVLLAQDGVAEGQRAFSKKQYPWYDAETDQVKRMEFSSRPDARSKDRDNVPVKSVVNPAGAGPVFNPNVNAGWLEALGVLAWVGVGGIVIILVGILIWAFLRMESNQPLEDDAPRRSMSESIKQLPFEMETTTGDFRQLAQAAYARGDYRKAMIYLFSHVLVSLDQKGLVRLRKGKTNRQYLRELRPHRPLANYYQHVMVPFEATFFGDHELTRDEFENCWNELEGFQSGVEKSSQVANV